MKFGAKRERRQLRFECQPDLNDAVEKECNLAQLSGRLLERDALRRTPAGIPVCEFLVGHSSTQIEADCERKVECEMACIVVGNLAQVLVTAHLGSRLRVSGFMAARSLKRRSLTLHVTTVEFVEGT